MSSLLRRWDGDRKTLPDLSDSVLSRRGYETYSPDSQASMMHDGRAFYDMKEIGSEAFGWNQNSRHRGRLS